MKTRKIPLRTCIGCNLIRPKMEMARVILTEKNELKLDKTGKVAGRGAYLCRENEEIERIQKGERLQTCKVNMNCAEAAKKKRAYERAFRQKIQGDLNIHGKEKEY